jgi:hypothetical protein
MATKIKVITARDFLEVTPDGVIDIDTSRQLLADIANAEKGVVDYDLLVDFRDALLKMSVVDVYQIVAELPRQISDFMRKVALLVNPGVDFDPASFFETCSHNRGFQINAFSDYEKAMRWLLSGQDAGS